MGNTNMSYDGFMEVCESQFEEEEAFEDTYANKQIEISKEICDYCLKGLDATKNGVVMTLAFASAGAFIGAISGIAYGNLVYGNIVPECIFGGVQYGVAGALYVFLAYFSYKIIPCVLKIRKLKKLQKDLREQQTNEK